MQVVLPRVADAAVDLRAVLQDPARGFAGRGLGRVARERAVAGGGVARSSPRTARPRWPAAVRATCRRACAGSPGTSRSAGRTACAPWRTRAPCRRCGARCRSSRPRSTRWHGRSTPRSARGRSAVTSTSRSAVSSWNERREKSMVETKRSRSRTASASTTATDGPGPTTAIVSTRSASSTNGFIGSSTERDGARARPRRRSATRRARSRGTVRARPRSRSRSRNRQRSVAGPAPSGRVLLEVSPQRLVHRRVVDVRAHERRRALAFEQLAPRCRAAAAGRR